MEKEGNKEKTNENNQFQLKNCKNQIDIDHNDFLVYFPNNQNKFLSDFHRLMKIHCIDMLWFHVLFYVLIVMIVYVMFFSLNVKRKEKEIET